MKKLTIGDEIELEVYSEICCDMCCEVIHNHIDCPVCNTEYASTDQYCNLQIDKETELTCDECGTCFEKISEYWYSDCMVKIKSFKSEQNER